MATEQITFRNIDDRARKMIMAGLLLAMVAACLDGTIVGTCGTKIATELKGMGLYSWMITAYMLAETIMIPMAGKLSDLYGRKPFFLAGLVLFTLGSVLAGQAANMEMLVGCRVIQGFGGGMLIPVATAAVADLYPPEKRGKMQGMLGAVFGIGSGIGPLLGGYIAEYADWRWCFYINVPIAIASFVLTMKKFPMPVIDEKPHIDYYGIAVLSAMLLDILLFFELGGKEFQWISVQSLLMILIAVVLLFVFIWIEKRDSEPVLSPKLVKNNTVTMSMVYMFIFGLGMIGSMVYANMFAIMVLKLSVLQAGQYSMALVAGMMITAMGSGMLLNKTGYKPWLVVGPIVTAAGMYMMSTMKVGTDLGFYAIALFVLGFGLGCMMGVVMTAVQNSSPEKEVGMTTSSVNLIRSIGTTVGTAIFALLIDFKFDMELKACLPAEVYNDIPHGVGLFSSDKLMKYAQYMGDFVNSFVNSISFTFIIAAIMMLVLVPIGIMFKAQLPKEHNTAEDNTKSDQI